MQRDPQTIARGMVLDIEHPIAGRTKAIGSPLKFSAGSSVTSRPAPRLGEHTREVLTELGYAASDIDRLIKAGAALAA
jgi:formyl-CoA transferase